MIFKVFFNFTPKKADIICMKNQWKILFFGLILCFMPSCSNNAPIGGGLKPLPKNPKPIAATPSSVFFGGYFNPVNSGLYKLLLSSCRRCGTKRIVDTPGGTVYQRIWTLSKKDPRRCENWLQEGYLQVEFEKLVLPATATVSIQPKYRNGEWGEAFSIKATARPINENKGFSIQVYPNQGLGGSYYMTVKSISNNPSQSQLDVAVYYGRQEDSSEMIYAPLSRLKSKSIDAIFTCDQYTN